MLSTSTNRRLRSIVGQEAIQRSLNCIQVDEFSKAKQLLTTWDSADQNACPMEVATLFRKNLLLARILRYQGDFQDSLTHLEKARNLAEQRQDLSFDEDYRDLICELADTLRELDEPVLAEGHLRAQIMQQAHTGITWSYQSLFELCLAEALFAQKRFKEAMHICRDIKSRTRFLKIEELRLNITIAKMLHVEKDLEGAPSTGNHRTVSNTGSLVCEVGWNICKLENFGVESRSSSSDSFSW